jgi:Tfp pilus assembly protein PilV
MSTRFQSRGALSGEEGFLLLEVIVSAAILLMVSLAAFAALDKSDALAGTQQRRTVAANLAQSELERVRSLPALDVANLRPTTTGKSTKVLNGTTYTIATTTNWLSDGKTIADCTSQNGGLDYLQASTSISWTNMGNAKPITMSALITPTAGTGADQTTGSLTALFQDRDGNGIPNLPVTLTGAQTFTDPTNSAGCVTWGLLPVAGTWEVKASIPDFVDVDGNPVIDDKPITLTGGDIVKKTYMYDHAGYTTTHFQTWDHTGNVIASPDQTTLQISNPGMTGGVADAVDLTKGPGAINSAGYWDGGPLASDEQLFPFQGADELYAGTCTAAEPQAPASPTYVNIPRNATQAAAPVMVPGQDPLVQTTGGANLTGAKVVVIDACGTVFAPRLTTNGFLTDPGYPYFASGYVCASYGGHYTSIATTNIKVGTATVQNLKISPTANSGPKAC